MIVWFISRCKLGLPLPPPPSGGKRTVTEFARRFPPALGKVVRSYSRFLLSCGVTENKGLIRLSAAELDSMEENMIGGQRCPPFLSRGFDGSFRLKRKPGGAAPFLLHSHTHDQLNGCYLLGRYGAGGREALTPFFSL